MARSLGAFVDSALTVFESDLKSVILYGSAAEGRLRAASDINLVLVLSAFDPSKAATLRGSFTAAHSAIRLTAMFLLESEITAAIESFGQKFSDIVRRHRVLYGADPFAAIEIPRAAVILRLKQVLLNLALRLREAYVERGSTPERLSQTIAESAGPLRSCAATLFELEGHPPAAPKEALHKFTAQLGEPAWDVVLKNMSESREHRLLSADDADATLIRLIDLAARLRSRVEALETGD